MVTNTVTYQCGCGYKTSTLVDASKHATETGHALTVTGMIRPA